MTIADLVANKMLSDDTESLDTYNGTTQNYLDDYIKDVQALKSTGKRGKPRKVCDINYRRLILYYTYHNNFITQSLVVKIYTLTCEKCDTFNENPVQPFSHVIK